MPDTLNKSLDALQADIMKLAGELHANKTFEAKLAEVKKGNVIEKISLLVQFIAALNGDICNGMKSNRKPAIEKLLTQLGHLNNIIKYEHHIHKEDKEKLTSFISANILSIGRVLNVTFSTPE